MGRRGLNHVVDFRHAQELFVTIKTRKTEFVADINTELLELLPAGVEPIRKDVAQRYNLDVFCWTIAPSATSSVW